MSLSNGTASATKYCAGPEVLSNNAASSYMFYFTAATAPDAIKRLLLPSRVAILTIFDVSAIEALFETDPSKRTDCGFRDAVYSKVCTRDRVAKNAELTFL